MRWMKTVSAASFVRTWLLNLDTEDILNQSIAAVVT